MSLSKPSHRMTPFICLWTRNGHRANLTMSTWLPVRISFFASTMDGWKNIFHRFRNNHHIHTFISDQRISVVLFQCSKSYIKLFAWNNQFTIDFLFAGSDENIFGCIKKSAKRLPLTGMILLTLISILNSVCVYPVRKHKNQLQEHFSTIYSICQMIKYKILYTIHCLLS